MKRTTNFGKMHFRNILYIMNCSLVVLFINWEISTSREVDIPSKVNSGQRSITSQLAYRDRHRVTNETLH